MTVKHTHPAYESDKERLRRLSEMKKTCRRLLAEDRKTAKLSA